MYLYSYGLHSYGLHSYGRYSYGLHSYGLYSYGEVVVIELTNVHQIVGHTTLAPELCVVVCRRIQ